MTSTKGALHLAAEDNGWEVVADTKTRLSFQRGDDYIGIAFNGGQRITYAEAFRNERAWKVFDNESGPVYCANERVRDQVLAVLAEGSKPAKPVSQVQAEEIVQGLSADVEEALLEVLLARRNAKIAAEFHTYVKGRA